MNLNEERNYQKLLETLDALELSETNRKLAEQYLDISQSENRELLKKAERQDLSQMNGTKESAAYVEHLNKRKRMEELGRYARFMVAVGGSTAHYVLVANTWYLRDLLGLQLSGEEMSAIRAEGMVWNRHMLNSRSLQVLYDRAKSNPDEILKAQELCFHKYDNAKVLLSGIYLHVVRPAASQGKVLGLFSKAAKGPKEVQDNVEFLINNLTNSIPSLFSNGKPADREIRLMQEFVRISKADMPFPPQILCALKGKQVSEYLLNLLSGVAFLAVEHSASFQAFLRLTAAMNLEETLNSCMNMSGGNWFWNHLKELDAAVRPFQEAYVAWCVKTGNRNSSFLGKALARVAAEEPEVIKTVASRVSTEEYQYLLAQVKQINLKLYQEMNASFAGKYDEKMAAELTNDIQPNNGQVQAKRYLLGEENVEALYPFVNSWRGGYTYNYQRFQRLKRMSSGDSQMFRRGMILEGLRMQGGYFTNYYLPPYRVNTDFQKYKRVLEGEVQKLTRIFEEEKLHIRYQADALDAIYSTFYNEQVKAAFMDAAVKALSQEYREHTEEFRDSTKTSTAIGRGISLRVLDSFCDQEKENILSCVMDSSKQVKEVLAALCAAHKDWEPDMKTMLKSKKSQEREIAVRAMKTWGAAAYQAELSEALAVEKSKKLKELLQGCLGIQGEELSAGQEGAQTAEELAAQVLKGGKKRKVAWAYETPLSVVHKLDKTEASEDYMQALLVAYADMSIPGVSADAVKLAAELDDKELAVYMSLLFDKWMKAGAEAKKKWVLYAAAIHGGEAIVSDLYHQIQEWPQHARGAMAAEAVKALALNGSSQALLLVDQISRKFKFRQVKTAAADALTYAAEQLGITRAELEDRIVPNLGFDEEMKQVFDYGTRSFTVYLTPALELEIFDKDEKKIKNLPAPGKRDEEEKAKAENERFKQMKKQLKTVVSNQKLRLEQALGTGRQWQVGQWKELFVKNPVMHQFAMGLIWGLYEGETLKATFRYMEDGSFNTVDEDEYEFPEEGAIGLVHPIELTAEELSGWKEQLSDYEVVQPVEQLERAVYLVTEEEKGQKELTRFGGRLLNGLSLSGKLQGQGWYRGSVEDAGVYCTFYREDGAIGVELSFSGSYVGDENDEVTVYEAAFYRSGTVKRGSYVYDRIKDENQYKLSEVSPRYFSEIVLQLTKATASSVEQVPYPECKR